MLQGSNPDNSPCISSPFWLGVSSYSGRQLKPDNVFAWTKGINVVRKKVIKKIVLNWIIL